MSLAFLKQHFIRSPQTPTSSSSQRSEPGPSIGDFLKKHFIRAPPADPSAEKFRDPRGSFSSGSPLPAQERGHSKEPSPWSPRGDATFQPSAEPDPGYDVEAQQRDRSSAYEENGEGSNDRRPRFKVDARVISDAIIGLSDGLTVPFALTAGLSTLGDKKVVIFGGLAELIAGAISMGLGGYLGAKSEAHSYRSTVKEATEMIDSTPTEAVALVRSTLEPYQLSTSAVDQLVTQLEQSHAEMLSFLLKFHHSVTEPGANRALTSAATIAMGYFFGGFVPLIPYFFVGHHKITDALWWSVIVMVFALFAFGYSKTCVVCGWRGGGNTWNGVKGGIEMVLVGGAAAGAAMGLVKAFNSAYG